VGVDPLVVGGALLVGLAFGSFLNVCIVRLPHDGSLLRPPSSCPHCHARIAWRDNIPVVSWLLLRGRCRQCGGPISAQYPLIELVVGLLWGGAALAWGPTLHALAGAVFGTILLGITVTDARHMLIPDEFTWGGLVLGLAFALGGGGPALVQALLGAAAGFALLYAIAVLGEWVFKEEAMGGGDIKMMAMVGAFVGWQGVLLTIFLGALFGTMIFLPLTLLGRKKLVPFGVFLSVGAAAAWLVGPAIIAWYRHYLGF
jgi:leader peptidase (prepilin peptidase)/N-methyltransferase